MQLLLVNQNVPGQPKCTWSTILEPIQRLLNLQLQCQSYMYVHHRNHFFQTQQATRGVVIFLQR
jgi:hypothetical protein